MKKAITDNSVTIILTDDEYKLFISELKERIDFLEMVMCFEDKMNFDVVLNKLKALYEKTVKAAKNQFEYIIDPPVFYVDEKQGDLVELQYVDSFKKNQKRIINVVSPFGIHIEISNLKEEGASGFKIKTKGGIYNDKGELITY